MKKLAFLLLTLGAMVLFSSCGSPHADTTVSQTLSVSAADNQASADYLAAAIDLPAELNSPYGAVFCGSTSYVIDRPQEENQDYVIFALDETGQPLRRYAVPNDNSGIAAMAPASDGSLWVLTSLWSGQDYAGSQLLHYTAQGDRDKEMTLDWLTECPTGLALDEENQCLYILTTQTLYVTEPDGTVRFSLQGICMSDMAVTEDGELYVSDSGDGSRLVRVLDLEKQTWGKTFSDVPYYGLSTGSADTLYAWDSQTIYCVDTQTGQATALVDLINLGFYSGVSAVVGRTESEMLFWSNDEIGAQLYRLTPSQGDGRIVLTVAAMEDGWYAGEIGTFNNSQDKYQIEIRYYENSTDGLTIYAMDSEGNIQQSYILPVEKGRVQDISPLSDGSLWALTALWDGSDYQGAHLIYFSKSGEIETDISLSYSSIAMWLLADEGRECVYVFEVDTLHCLDTEGTELFSLMGTSLCYPCLTADGRMAVCDKFDDVSHIRTLDFDGQRWGEMVAPDVTCKKIFGGFLYDLYVIDDTMLYGLNLDTGETVPILELLDAGVGSTVLELTAMTNGRFMAWATIGGADGLYILTPSDGETRTVLTIAAFESGIFEQEVLKFNASQDEYKLKVTYYENDSTGQNRLNLDIASGDGPDIFYLNGMPISQYIKQGILEDLYSYLDADPDVDREQFVSSLLTSMEKDGKLYAFIPHVCLLSLLTAPDVLSETSDISFQDLLDAANESDPFGSTLSRYDFLQYAIAGYDSPFVDWEDGSCSFDSQEFMDVLALASLLPEEADYSGTPILTLSLLSGEGVYAYESVALGNTPGDMATVHGLPGTDGERYLLVPSGSSWGMAADSENKEGVWAFFKTYLSDEYQASNMFPLTQSAVDAAQEEYAAWVEAYGEYEVYTANGEIIFQVDDTSYFDAFMDCIGAANGLYEENPALMEILWSEAQAYFAGDKTVEQAADNIQSRVSLYLAEQG